MSNNNQEVTVNNIPLREYDELLDLQLNYNKYFDELNERFVKDKQQIEDKCWEDIKKDRAEYSESVDKWRRKCAELEEKIKELEECIRQIEKGNEQLINIIKERTNRLEKLKNRTLIQRIFRKYE